MYLSYIVGAVLVEGQQAVQILSGIGRFLERSHPEELRRIGGQVADVLADTGNDLLLGAVDLTDKAGSIVVDGHGAGGLLGQMRLGRDQRRRT